MNSVMMQLLGLLALLAGCLGIYYVEVSEKKLPQEHVSDEPFIHEEQL